MTFPHDDGLIPRLGHETAQELIAGPVEAVLVRIGGHAVYCRMNAGDEAGPGGDANRAFGGGVGEPDALPGQLIQMRRSHSGVSGTAHAVGTVLVAGNQKNMRLSTHSKDVAEIRL